MMLLVMELGGILPDYRGPRPVDFYSTLIGAFFAGVFAWTLAALIIKSRRYSPADISLAAVFAIWGVICFFAVYRLYHLQLIIPYVTPSLWALATLGELAGIYFIIRELRSGPSSEGYSSGLEAYLLRSRR